MADVRRDGAQPTGAVVIGDVVSSRSVPDRAGLQARLSAMLTSANRSARVTQRLHMTIGDEFQGAVASLPDALRLGLDLRLDLLPEAELRIGVGLGPFEVFDPSATPVSQDGPAWWAARRAVETAKDLGARPPSRHVRSWAAALDTDGREPSEPVAATVTAVNAYLGMQDFVLSTMTPRQLRLLAAVLRGEPQRDAARREQITQSAVSQSLHSSGAQALCQALAILGASSDAPSDQT
jgi:hypothetical protein